MKKSILILFVLVNLVFADFIRDDDMEVVIDTSTKLMWQDDSNASSVIRNWSDAITHCENMTLAGYSDWHLPNLNELYMLADRSIYSPSLSSAFNNVVSSNYWSSTTYASDTTNAWGVHFNRGNDYCVTKALSYYVRCVRSAD